MPRRPRRKKKRAVRVFGPEEPEARDEGPRLLPLSEEQRRESRLDHYVTLANIALGIADQDGVTNPPHPRQK